MAGEGYKSVICLSMRIIPLVLGLVPQKNVWCFLMPVVVLEKAGVKLLVVEEEK